VLDGQTGFLFPYGDAAALAAIFQRLAGDAELVQKLGQAGRRLAETLSWERAANETAQHLKECLQP
jgi:glycosyltransferase involved in cell wall biosynthesis